MPVAREGERRQGHDVLLVVAAGDDGVQLDRPETGCLGRLDAGPDLLHRSPAHEPGEADGVETVDVDVHAAETGGGETLGEPWEQDAVGGHGEIADARNAGQLVLQTAVDGRIAVADDQVGGAGQGIGGMQGSLAHGAVEAARRD